MEFAFLWLFFLPGCLRIFCCAGVKISEDSEQWLTFYEFITVYYRQTKVGLQFPVILVICLGRTFCCCSKCFRLIWLQFANRCLSTPESWEWPITQISSFYFHFQFNITGREVRVCSISFFLWCPLKWVWFTFTQPFQILLANS